MANTRKDTKLEELSKQEVPEPVYTAEFSKEDIDGLESILQYCSDSAEHNDFVDQLMDNVEGDTSDWENWKNMEDIPEKLLLEFDEVSSHNYRASMLLYKVIAPLIRQRNLDLQEQYSARTTK